MEVERLDEVPFPRAVPDSRDDIYSGQPGADAGVVRLGMLAGLPVPDPCRELDQRQRGLHASSDQDADALDHGWVAARVLRGR